MRSLGEHIPRLCVAMLFAAVIGVSFGTAKGGPLILGLINVEV